ncbi:hypothetical protein PAXRUDRAFT_153117 [Paxillus rubicundulus Ve08.2h10]|uniref:Unplaced genomic scaffold scaffold_768, whole genome shotgun sequence n=1 Tax=Paxillus rubicundulus Ve08.2h10 TaxID=930991 RepID=A0A0D0D599_9AGAM|nr:hypothetical protein PAXRUDRAFT_153117 [Paxillus rubicundulus Ve08.2h10]
MVGHSSKNGCHIYCGVVSHQKTNGRHYYPILIKPQDHCVAGSDHVDYNVFDLPSGSSHTYTQNLKKLVSSPNQTQYDKHKMSTGITKAPLILGMSPSCSLGVPYCMTTNIMHLAGNLSDLLISLRCGMIDCDATDAIDSWDWAVLSDGAIWDTYGVSVHKTGSHLPGSFGTQPCNIAKKLTSGYKTWELQLHTFSLGPILLYNILPDKYFTNYCTLVCGFQIMCQHSITTKSLVSAQSLLCQWEHGFKHLYY